MKKYNVSLEVYFEVEADSEEEALQKATEYTEFDWTIGKLVAMNVSGTEWFDDVELLEENDEQQR